MTRLPTADESTGAPTRAGAIRRFFNAWRRWEELMDHSPYDYTLDRIKQLESRVLELERARNATIAMPLKSMNAPDMHAGQASRPEGTTQDSSRL
jgi:hypothetical protein